MKFYQIILFVFILLLHSIALSAQSHKDSLRIDSLEKALSIQKDDTNKINSFNKLCDLLDNNPKASLEYAKKSLSLSQKLNFKKGIAKAYYYIANNFMLLGTNDSQSLQAANASIKIREQLGDKKGIAECLDVIAVINYTLGNYPEGLKYMYDALKIYEATDDNILIINSLLNIASVNTSQQDDSDALKNDLAALQFSQKISDKSNIAISSLALAGNYYTLKKYPEALDKAFSALALFKQINNGNSIWAIPLLYTTIAKVYAKEGEADNAKGNNKSALNNFTKSLNSNFSALKLYKKSNDNNNNGIASCYLNIGKVYVSLHNLTAAGKYLQKSLQLSKTLNVKPVLRDNYDALSTLDSLHGNYKDAYDNYRKYIAYRDSLNNEGAASLSARYKMQYEFDKKQAAEKAEQDKKDIEAKRIKNQQYFFMAALTVIVMAVLLIALQQYKNNKQKHKANIALQLQKQKVENTLSELKSTQSQLIQSEKMASLGELTAGIAHEIQNPLNFVNNFSEVSNELLQEIQEERNKAQGTRNEQLQDEILNDIKINLEKINHHGKRADSIVKGMLQHSRQTKGMKESTDINALCDEYLRLSYHGLRAKDKNFNADFNTDFDESMGKINIVPQDIGRVLLNLFNNAFYTVYEKKKTADENYKPLVSIQTKRINDNVEITTHL